MTPYYWSLFCFILTKHFKNFADITHRKKYGGGIMNENFEC